MHLLPDAPALTRRLASGWQEAAACATAPDPEAWFPAPRTPEADLVEPLRVCSSCPVRRACLAFGLLNGETGLWGGVTDDERIAASHAIAAGADLDDTLDELILGHVWQERRAG
jgi:hypothetical protein